MELRSAVGDSSRSLYATVCGINAALFVAAAGVLVISPATVSAAVTGQEIAVLVVGVLAVVVTNALVLRSRLVPLDRLARQVDTNDVTDLSWRLAIPHRAGVERSFVTAINTLLDRLTAEQSAVESAARAAEDAERQRIARELHDEVGQRLTVVLLSVSRLSKHVSTWQRQELTLVQENTRESLEHVRGVAHGLRGGMWEDLDLAGALTSLAATFRGTGALRVVRHFDQTLPDLGAQQQQAIFRIAQESLTNAARHAHADTAVMHLHHDPQLRCLTLTVTDNGVGYRSGATGRGIAGMRERARSVGGTLTVTAKQQGGTEVRLTVPSETP